MNKTLLARLLTLCLLGTILFAAGTEPTDGDLDGNREVSTLDHLLWICTNPAGWSYDYEQTADIDASVTQYWDDADDDTDGNAYNDANDATGTGNNEGFIALGTAAVPFSGTYDGQGYAIDGLTIDRSSTNYIGFFGNTSGATIQNLGITNCNFIGDAYVGGFVGNNASSSSIETCYATGYIEGHNQDNGGFAGQNTGSGTSINKCFSTVTVYSPVMYYIGGFVGYNASSATITNSYCTGDVSSTLRYCGGFVGINIGSATITNCYSRGDVTRTTGSSSVFAAFASYNSSTLENCYATGSVYFTGATDPTIKGFVSDDNSGTYNDNFWNSSTSNQSTGTGATAISTSSMKNSTTFIDAGWDFTANGEDDDWSITPGANDGFPHFIWAEGLDLSLPVVLSYFQGESERYGINLSWQTDSEMENTGFILKRHDGSGNFQEIVSHSTSDALLGAGSTTQGARYSWLDRQVTPGKRYHYILLDSDYSNIQRVLSEITVTHSLFKEPVQPGSFSLVKAYPNPFNPEIRIDFTLSHTMAVSATLYDIHGRQVAILQAGELSQGTNTLTWDGRNHEGEDLSTGIYFCRLQSVGVSSTIRLVYLR